MNEHQHQQQKGHNGPKGTVRGDSVVVVARFGATGERNEVQTRTWSGGKQINFPPCQVCNNPLVDPNHEADVLGK